MTSGSRGERPEGGGGRLGEERAHGPRLAQKSLHGGQMFICSKYGASIYLRVRFFGRKGKVRQDHFGGVREGRNQFICAPSVRKDAKMAVVHAGGRQTGFH
jgi:hypothetical protein